MLETYSQNITVLQNTAIPFNSTSIRKGCTAVKTDVNTIELNKSGIYMVSFDAVASTSTTSGNIVVQMSKNGTLEPQAITATTSTGTTDIESLSFVTLVQVSEDNSCNCCDSPVILKFLNTGIGAIYVQANVVVTKIC